MVLVQAGIAMLLFPVVLESGMSRQIALAIRALELEVTHLAVKTRWKSFRVAIDRSGGDGLRRRESAPKFDGLSGVPQRAVIVRMSIYEAYFAVWFRVVSFVWNKAGGSESSHEYRVKALSSAFERCEDRCKMKAKVSGSREQTTSYRCEFSVGSEA